MIFGKIDFINLLPFHVYLKKNITSSQLKSIIEYKKSYPSKINTKFLKKQVDSAFVSSIISHNQKKLDLGIVAKDKVLSVFVIPSDSSAEDYQSQTSNALAKILNINGKVMIGDKALKYYCENNNSSIVDLAKEWKRRYNLPFVFAVLCYNSNGKLLKKYVKKFDKHKIKIPQYILNQYSKKTMISSKNILDYLKKIDYKIEQKEKKSLKKFINLAIQKGLL